LRKLPQDARQRQLAGSPYCLPVKNDDVAGQLGGRAVQAAAGDPHVGQFQGFFLFRIAGLFLGRRDADAQGDTCNH